MKVFIFLSLFSIHILGQETNFGLNLHGLNKVFYSEFNLNYETKNRTIFKIGFSYGIINKDINNDDTDFPYRNFEEGISYPNNKDFRSYFRSSFSSLKVGQGINIGIGTSWEINNKISILLNGSFIYFAIKDYVKAKYLAHGLYYSIEDINPASFFYSKTILYNTISAGVSTGIMYQVSKKSSLILLINLPYYFPLRNNDYDALGIRFGAVALEPNLSIGINYIIKKQ